MNSSNVMVRLATVGPIGYLIAPGTVASCLTIPIVAGISYATSGNAVAYGILVLIFTLVSFSIIEKALAVLRCHHDPSEIVLDEMVGMMLTFWMIPLTTPALVLGLILFRFFDIIKLGPVKESQRLPGAWGILADDLLAALLSNIILRFLF